MKKIEIKNRLGKVIFEYESENNTLKETVEKAVKDGASLNRANLNGANLNGAKLNGAILNGANLNWANLNGAILNRASLDGAILNGANLNRASLNGASLNGASLNGANLNRASLDGASLDGASLNMANLNMASLNGANLNRAKNMVKIMGVEPGNIYWKKIGENLINEDYQFKVGLNTLRKNEVFADDPRALCSCPGFHFASKSWCEVKYPERPYLAKIRIPEDAMINEPWATDGKASADKIDILQVFDKEGNDVTEKFTK